MKKRLIATTIVIIMLLTFVGCSDDSKINSENPLESWNADSLNKQKIIEFVNAVIDENSEDFVPVEDRIATFDMDGTIICEKPLWLELAVAEYRILNDLKDNKELVDEVNRLNKDLSEYPEPSETGKLIGDVTGKAFYNMPQQDFVEYMEEFMNTERTDFVDMKYKDTFYKPMIELINYLIENDFQVYIVSGSERGVIWGACKETLSILPRSHEIGADITLKATHEESSGESGYIFQKDDKLLRQLGFTQKNLDMWKVYNIYHQIGMKPIFAFGNTDGDFSMLNYSKSNEKYNGISFLLCHDDDVREYDYHKEERNAWNSKAEENGWNIVYMSKEFEKVFMKDTEKKK